MAELKIFPFFRYPHITINSYMHYIMGQHQQINEDKVKVVFLSQTGSNYCDVKH